MCKSKKDTHIIHSSSPKSLNHPLSSSSSTSASFNTNYASITNSSTHNKDYKPSKSSSSSSISSPVFSSKSSFSTLKRSFLPESPHIYDFSEICKATNNFLSKPFSSSSSSTSWRCKIRQKEVVLFQRKFCHRPVGLPELQQRLLTICRSHHSSLIKLLGAAVSGNYIYLVYEHVHGANLSTCLRNPQNLSYTVLSSWLSRMQIATDVAHGLDYIHHCSGLNCDFVHNHVKSSSILVTGDSLNAQICHFGTAELCGEMVGSKRIEGIRIEGTRGYMAPEFRERGIVSQKCDVYAFGVVVLELVSGEEALRYVFDEGSGGYRKISVIDSARDAVAGGKGVGGVRKWVDRRLKDSFPEEVAEKMVLVGLECLEEDPKNRPDMGQVAVRVSKLYLESKNWAEKIGMPTDISVSMVPR